MTKVHSRKHFKMWSFSTSLFSQNVWIYFTSRYERYEKSGSAGKIILYNINLRKFFENFIFWWGRWGFNQSTFTNIHYKSDIWGLKVKSYHILSGFCQKLKLHNKPYSVSIFAANFFYFFPSVVFISFISCFYFLFKKLNVFMSLHVKWKGGETSISEESFSLKEDENEQPHSEKWMGINSGDVFEPPFQLTFQLCWRNE